MLQNMPLQKEAKSHLYFNVFYNFISAIINKKHCSFLVPSIQFVENS